MGTEEENPELHFPAGDDSAPVPPPIAPLPIAMPPPAVPLSVVRPPVFRPPAPMNEDLGGSSDSEEDLGPEEPGVEYEISEESRQVRERQEKAMQDLMLRRRAAALAVPTNDQSVRARLRRLGEPMTLFGEREMERRERLRMIMAKLDADGQLETLMKAQEEEEAADSAAAGGDEMDEDKIEYPFFTEGSMALRDARMDMAKFSLARAALRLQRAHRRRDDPDEDVGAEMDWALNQAASLSLDCSERADERPLLGCSFSRNGDLLATSSMTGVGKLWKLPGVIKSSMLKGHTERAHDIVFSPVDDRIATASADRTAKLWCTNGTLLRSFEGHLDRIPRIAFHPSGKYLGTTSFDKTWRLWDIESGEELLLQEGHSRAVYGIDFHPDGSLAGTCGLDALARVWDLRTGRSALALEGHVKPVYGISFSPNGYHLATGGDDNTCRIWDLRKKRSIYTIPAHSKLLSRVKFEPQEGYFLVTASYDMTAKVWSARDFRPVKTLLGHEEKITSMDIVGDGSCIATVSHDKTIKIWRSSNKDQRMDVD